MTTTTTAAVTDTRYSFCPAWCIGHDLEDTYPIDEDNLDANRYEPGAPEGMEVGDVVCSHGSDGGGGRAYIMLRRMDSIRGGDLVAGGGRLTTGETMLLIQGESIEGPAIVTLATAGVLAARMIETVDSLLNPEDHR